ncbi:MAG TPA: flagellin, partial [Sulfuricurvum sp.]|nr:flagellin [Sulfuricurvum sp.]
TTMTSADYVQYTVEGSVLAGVQMTSSTGAGIAGAGLGAVADQINATSDTTGVKAIANVEKNSNIRVQGMTTASDIIINGSTILQSGQTILAGDTDNGLINAINAKKDYTGVTANLEGDGTITLTSDGRAMQVTGLSGVAGISNGTYGGTLSVTKNNLDVLNLSGAHYTNASLTAAATNAHSQTEVIGKNKLSDLVFGQVDDNKDGSIDNDDKIGLLSSREGAAKAMDIVESAIKTLDGIRADLGSAQNQLIVTVNNISVTQVNVRAAESQIRDVDFAAESANFSKYNILAQSGSYAMSQANAVQQNVLKLLQ